jgi:light-regulated signal transduction histidine kinase (bacteriophytochrome)/DNA-binding XRE family transcriptional regulator
MYFSSGNEHARMKPDNTAKQERKHLTKNTTLLKAIAHRIKQLRKNRGITQVGFFLDTNIHIGRIETGKVNISICTLQEICVHLKVSLTEFFSGIENHTIPTPDKALSRQAPAPEKDFLSVIAPHLQGSVTSLSMLTSYFRQTGDEAKKEELFKLMNEHISRLAQKVNYIHEIEAIHKKIPLIKRVDFKEIVNFISLEYTQAIAGNHLELKTNFKQCQRLYYAEAYILTIFTQLLKQAFACRSAGQTVKISLHTRPKNGFVSLVYHDNGPGMNLKKNRADSLHPVEYAAAGQQENTLGLYVIQLIVEKNGGYMEIESEPGKGTAIALYLKEYAAPDTGE